MQKKALIKKYYVKVFYHNLLAVIFYLQILFMSYEINKLAYFSGKDKSMENKSILHLNTKTNSLNMQKALVYITFPQSALIEHLNPLLFLENSKNLAF